MVPEGYIVTKQQITSNAARQAWRWNTYFGLNARLRRLTHVWRSRGGRGGSGVRIIRTRGTRSWRIRTPRLNYQFWVRPLAFVADFTFMISQNKFVSLVFLSNGALMYINAMHEHRLFTCEQFSGKRQIGRIRIPHWFAILGAIAKLTLISLVELVPKRGAQYIRGGGGKGRLFAFDMARRAAVVELPSKLKKTFSLYSMAGTSPLMGDRGHQTTRAGFWRGLGFKSTVRGVAMNPVDHPHGGRTKSLRYPKTPWGKTTKYK